MSIQLNSKLRVNLTFNDINEETGAVIGAINLGSVVESVVITKPSGAVVATPVLTTIVAANGTAYWEAAAGVLDQVGKWRVQGNADGYLSAPVEFRVVGNP